MASSAVEQVIKSEIQHYPGVDLELKDGGKHDRAVFHFEDRSRFLTIPKTPSDWRATQNMRRDLKKTLEELGAKRATSTLPRKGTRTGHFSKADATLGLQAASLSMMISKGSKLHKRFELKDPKQAWSFELRSSPDLSAPPLLVLKEERIPEGNTRARMGMVRAQRSTRTGAIKIVMSRSVLPDMLKRAPSFRAVDLKLYANDEHSLVFKLPNGVLPTGYQPHHDRNEEPAPLPSKAFVPKPPAPETPDEPVAPPVASPAPAAPFPAVLRLELPKGDSLTVERAIRFLNQQKLKLGNSLRFTVNEGGALSAVHRIQ